MIYDKNSYLERCREGTGSNTIWIPLQKYSFHQLNTTIYTLASPVKHSLHSQSHCLIAHCSRDTGPFWATLASKLLPWKQHFLFWVRCSCEGSRALYVWRRYSARARAIRERPEKKDFFGKKKKLSGGEVMQKGKGRRSFRHKFQKSLQKSVREKWNSYK